MHRLLLPLLGALLLFPSIAPAQGDLPRDLLPDERNTVELFRDSSASVAFITNVELRRGLFSRNVMEVPRGSGSGFVWDDKGHVVTNFHVIRDGNAFSVTLADGESHPAELVGFDQNKDLAVLRIDVPREKLRPIPLGDSDGLLVGQKVLAIGNPFGLDQTLTTGVISALGREIQSVAGTTITDVIQTDASINPGNSGGPLLDSKGRLIGVNTAIYSPSGASAGVGFAVPVAHVLRIVPQLIERGRVRRAGLGVTLVPDDLARRWGVRGVIIREVMDGSSAQRAGLRPIGQDRRGRVVLGDVIVGIDDREIRRYDDLFMALDQREPGEEITVRVLRGRKEERVRMKLQEIQ